MKNQITTLLFLLLNSLLAQAAIYKLSSEQGRVIFMAKGKPALITIKGEGEGVSAKLVEKNLILNGVISFQLKSLKTGIELRDDHLKNKYLEVGKFPTALLTINDLKIPTDLKSEINFTGTLNLHGVDQSIEGLARFQSESKTQLLIADFKIRLSQFKIEIPNFKGITVAEEVQIKIEAHISKEE